MNPMIPINKNKINKYNNSKEDEPPFIKRNFPVFAIYLLREKTMYLTYYATIVFSLTIAFPLALFASFVILSASLNNSFCILSREVVSS